MADSSVANFQSDDRAPYPSGRIRVLLAANEPLLQLGLRRLFLDSAGRMELVGTATTAHELVCHQTLDDTDVLLLDLRLMQFAAFDIRRLIAEHDLDVVLLADEDDPRKYLGGLQHGALGVVMKNRPVEDLMHAIECVHSGEVWLERSQMATLIKSGVSRDNQVLGSDEHERLEMLTVKERQLIATLVKHRGAKSFIVADALGISERTVRNRLSLVYEKLHVRGKLNLYLYALEHGLGKVSVD